MKCYECFGTMFAVWLVPTASFNTFSMFQLAPHKLIKGQRRLTEFFVTQHR